MATNRLGLLVIQFRAGMNATKEFMIGGNSPVTQIDGVRYISGGDRCEGKVT